MKTKFNGILTLLLAFVVQLSFAQEKTISGTVVDETNMPLPGATVVIKGTTTGTSTDFDGNYSITANTGDVLTFSYVGYADQDATIGASDKVDISLAPDNTLKEVVVVAYGTSTKDDLVGSIGQLKAEKVEQTQLPSIDQALQGNIAGVTVNANSGAPGAAAPIFIRGVGSINASTQPLFVIDGVPMAANSDISRLATSSNPLATIDPNSIESISVLKDASAASIYGSRAANGVIIITTKQGKKGVTKISLSSEYSFGDEAYNELNVHNSQEYIDLMATGFVNGGFFPDFDTAQNFAINSFPGWDQTTDTDWQDITRNNSSTVESHTLSLRGGNEKTAFAFSGSFYRNEPLMKGSDFQRVTGSLNLNHKVNDRLDLSLAANGSRFTQNTISDEAAFSNPMLTGLLLQPTESPYNSDGSYNQDFGNLFDGFNPLPILDTNFQKALTTRWFGNIGAKYRIMDGLHFNTKLGGDAINVREDLYWAPGYGDGEGSQGYGAAYHTRRDLWNFSNYLDYNKIFAEKHNVGLTLGYEAQETTRDNITAENQNYAPGGLTGLNNAADPQAAGSSSFKESLASFFTRAQYSFDDRYNINGSYRRDGSSKFGANFQYGNFWSVGASWNIHNEAFMSNVDAISTLRLRSSYGVNGNDGIGNFQFVGNWTFGSDYNGNPGAAINNVPNPDLKWEVNKPFNVGLDFGVLQERITGTVEYYTRKTEDLLLNQTTPESGGYGGLTALANVGSMENKGIEVTLNAHVFKPSSKFQWNISANVSTNKNEITNLGASGDDIFDGSKIIREGESIGTWWLRGWAGVDPTNGDPLWYTDETETATTNDVNQAERYAQGNSLPTITAGLRNDFSYKGFSLSSFFTYAGDYNVYDRWAFVYDSDGAFGALNQLDVDRWSPSNPNASRPAFVFNNGSNSNASSTRYLYEGDHIRLRELKLAYKLPNSLTDRLKMDGITLYVKGTNLWTHTFDDDLYFDPETGSNDYGTSITGAGVFDLTIPNMRTYSFGVKLDF